MITFQQLATWSQTTWSRMLGNARNRDGAAMDIIHAMLPRLRNHMDYTDFSSRQVTGAISQGWKDLNKSGPLFQNSLENVAAQWPGDWTPAEYQIDYFKACRVQAPQDQLFDLGRALRNLPSFLREYFLCEALRAQGYEAQVPSVDANASHHIDISLAIGDRSVTIWSYLDTPKARNMLGVKIRSRGMIIGGLNLLAPITMVRDTTDWCDWRIPSRRYVNALIQACQGAAISNKELLAGIITPGYTSAFRLFEYKDSQLRPYF